MLWGAGVGEDKICYPGKHGCGLKQTFLKEKDKLFLP